MLCNLHSNGCRGGRKFLFYTLGAASQLDQWRILKHDRVKTDVKRRGRERGTVRVSQVYSTLRDKVPRWKSRSSLFPII